MRESVLSVTVHLNWLPLSFEPDFCNFEFYLWRRFGTSEI